VIESQANSALALEAARAAIVLLKNDGGLLPLDRKAVRSIAVIGPHGDDVTLGGYSG
jgi:beta-glucosidase